MKGYFAVDLIIDNDNRMHIIDIHGYSDAVSFSERAGYKPRKSRIHKFVEIAKKTAKDKKIIHLLGANLYGEHRDYNFPSGVFEFFSGLPNGSYNIDWIERKFEREKKLTSKILEDELLFLDQAARAHKIDYLAGELYLYDNALLLDRIDIRKNEQQLIEVPFDEIGLVIPWGKNYAMHPEARNYWKSEQISLPVLTSKYMHYIFNTDSKKVRNEIFRKVTNALPEEVFIGLASSTCNEISKFIEKHKNFVYKPVSAHSGIDIQYFTKEEAIKFAEQERRIEHHHKEILEKIEIANKKGFKPEDKKFMGYFFTNDGNSRFKMNDMGVYTLQERISARPFKSFKTGMKHTGTIRAQIYNGEPIGIMHRFSTEDYSGNFQRITDSNHKTFWERVDDNLENKIVDFLVPIFTDVEILVNEL